jgi:hypothetical protein
MTTGTTLQMGSMIIHVETTGIQDGVDLKMGQSVSLELVNTSILVT